jgi:hypothetical protein
VKLVAKIRLKKTKKGLFGFLFEKVKKPQTTFNYLLPPSPQNPQIGAYAVVFGIQ